MFSSDVARRTLVTQSLIVGVGAIIGVRIIYKYLFSKKQPTVDTFASHVDQKHGPLVELANNCWVVEGNMNYPIGTLPRVMTIYRTHNRELILHSVVALREEAMKELESLGKISVIIVPNKWHRLDAGVYASRYPTARVVAPRCAVKEAVEIVGEKVEVAEDILPEYGITPHVPAGYTGELFYELPLAGKERALVCSDLLFNIPTKSLFFRLVGVATDGETPCVSRGYRAFMFSDRAAYGKWLGELASRLGDNLHFVTLSHGKPITKNCVEKLKTLAATLT